MISCYLLMLRRRRGRSEESPIEALVDLVGAMIVMGGGYLLVIYLTNKEKFWDTINHTVLPATGIIFVLVVGFVVFRIWLRKKQAHHIEDILQKIEKGGFGGEMKSFLDRFGKEKGHNCWEYRGYAFEWKRLNEFRDILRQKEIVISKKDYKELAAILRHYIDEKERIFVQESITATSAHHFGELNKTGDDFERLVVRMYEAMGYASKRVGGHGDQGGDVIANKNGESILVQAKCYEGSVGNAAVQQAVAARQHYGCNKAVVATTSFFTTEALALAKSNSIELIDRKILQQRLAEYLHESWK